jgi:Domain of unknown function (DUF2017)
MRTRVRAAGDGGVDIRLEPELRELIGSLAGQLRALIDDPEAQDSPGLARLFPPASVDDPMEALGFEQLMGEALRAGKRETAAVVLATANNDHLDPEETLAWMRCLNDVRLVLGTRLEIEEDTDLEELFRDPMTEQAAIMYTALTELVGMLSLAADPR